MSQRPVNEGETCYRCAYYSDAGYNGSCHRHAPVRNEDGYAGFPKVSHGEWCGDWKLRPERAEIAR